MKRTLIVILALGLIGCSSSKLCTSNVEPATLDWIAQSPIEALHIQSTPLYPSGTNHSVTNESIIVAFCAGLTRSHRMPSIDTTGTHTINIVSSDGQVIIESSAYQDWGFIRLSEYAGDSFYECDKEMAEVLKQIGVHQVVEPENAEYSGSVRDKLNQLTN